ncbi:hypothetical protein ARTSIC4J27_617 [Pseudarthrobacter siccitolerans]|uniref:Uncharacterized protein n=1 Tax=Pseudarthrobacter siccitolerans TaxID=861266 RepID=A0A024GY33_9MICC|nr:hypothetical protein [Pseudarthrobacter siccitolerans]CCQ44688.1 hypothetical protein ARTSIC4J27_617 [Pseudarthrobacter siccitolerans]
MTTPAPSFSLPLTVRDADGDKLTVSASPEIGIARGAEGALVQTVETHPGASLGVFVSKDEAPAVALAILISAGINPDAHGNVFESAAAALASVFAKKDREAKLEAEALDFLNAFRSASNLAPLEDLGALNTREAWLRVAKHARKSAAQASA